MRVFSVFRAETTVNIRCFLYFLLILAGILPPAKCHGRDSLVGLTPFYYRNCLVAGSSAPGYKDGNFLEAAFNFPQGLALSKDATRLYVADAGNDAIRIINLENSNEVSTLAKGPLPGGSLKLSSPMQLLLTPDGERLLVLDRSQSPLKMLELKSGLWKDLFQGLSPAAEADRSVCSMALDFQGKWLYFQRPNSDALDCIDLADGLRFPVARQGDLGLNLQLASGQSGLVAFRSSDGAFYRLSIGSSFIAGNYYVPLSFRAQVTMTPFGPKVPNGTGLTSQLGKDGNDYFMVWDPAVSGVRYTSYSGMTGVNFFADYSGAALAGPVPQSGTAETSRPYFLGPLSMILMPANGGYYVAESLSNRVLKVKGGPEAPHEGYSSDFFIGDSSGQTGPKEPGVTRIMWVGSSESFSPGKDVPQNPTYYLGAQFELYLNLFSGFMGNEKIPGDSCCPLCECICELPGFLVSNHG